MGVTATATELNYMDGVTSNVQTQLDGKANASALGDQVTYSLSGTTLTITSKVGSSITWTKSGSNYYNAAYNIYIYPDL